jgi:hypothetical protein
MASRFAQLDSQFAQVDSKIEKVMAGLHRLTTLVEEKKESEAPYRVVQTQPFDLPTIKPPAMG